MENQTERAQATEPPSKAPLNPTPAQRSTINDSKEPTQKDGSTTPAQVLPDDSKEETETFGGLKKP
jgi:hypothetical protein